jgi:Spy/CpxP family protein refolding chaperone
MTKFTRFMIAAAFSATLMLAQGPGGRRGPGGTPPDPQQMAERRVNFLTRTLNLTDAQKSQATTIFTNAATAAQSIHTNMQTARQTLRDAVKKNDSAAIDQAAQTIGNLTGQLTSIEGKANAAFYAILTPDQQTKFDSGPGRGFGPGMGPQGFGRSRMGRGNNN